MAELFRAFPELEFVVITAVMLAAGFGAQVVIERRNVRRLQTAHADANGGPYRVAAQDESSRPLTLGQLPRADQLWTVAWLRADWDGITQALMAHGGAAGWLVGSGSGFRVIEPAVIPDDPVAAGFWDELHHHVGEVLTGPEVHGMARRTAMLHQSTLRRRASDAGLVRSDRERHNLYLVWMIAGLAAEVAFLIRLFTATNAVDLRAGWMIAVLGAIVLLSAMLSSWSPRTRAAKRYLVWLGEETRSLVSEVSAGRRRQPVDVTLAVAIGGISTVASRPGIGDLALAYERSSVRQG